MSPSNSVAALPLVGDAVGGAVGDSEGAAVGPFVALKETRISENVEHNALGEP